MLKGLREWCAQRVERAGRGEIVNGRLQRHLLTVERNGTLKMSQVKNTRSYDPKNRYRNLITPYCLNIFEVKAFSPQNFNLRIESSFIQSS